jgi:hypothetical protein
MSKFSYLEKLDVSASKTVEYTINEIDSQPKLLISPATEANKPYFNAILRRARKNNKAVQAGAINVGIIQSNRNEDRELYAQHIIKGWEGVVDDRGKVVEFNATDCLEFLQALPDYIFDGIREFASNPQNHTSQESIDVETTAKN